MKTNDLCRKFTIDDRRVQATAAVMESGETFQRLAETFRVLGDANRLKILYALSVNELCVCEITTLTEMTQPAVSHQLRILRNMRLVKYRKVGRSVFYSLDDDHIKRLFQDGLKHVKEEKIV